MKDFYIFTLAAGISLTALTGCIDDDYDLSDVDTNSQFKVNDLVIPVNLDRITLDNVVDIESGSKIKIVNGEYVAMVDGTFESFPVNFKVTKAESPSMTGEAVALELHSDGQRWIIPPVDKSFQYEVYDIDNAIHDIDSIGVGSMTFDVVFRSSIPGFRVTNLVMRMPAGMSATCHEGTYDPATGRLKVDNLQSTGQEAKITLMISGIKFDNGNSTFDASNHRASYYGPIDVVAGEITAAGNTSGTPTLEIDYRLSPITVEKISGLMEYKWEDFGIETIDLSDIPSFFNQPGTDIHLVNPQLYLSFNNPLSPYGVTGEVDLELQAFHHGGVGGRYMPDDGGFEVGSNGASGHYDLYLSPMPVENPYPDFAGAVFHSFTTLGDMLSGDGLPERIAVNVTEARYPLQKVKGLRLGVNYGSVNGNYLLYAPLDLKEGSVVRYEDTIDGWNDEDVDALTISSLEVTALVTSDLPLAIDITGHPIGVDGKPIDNVSIEGATVPAGATEYPVTIKISGAITHLDGLKFTASCVAADAASVIKPTQSINITHIRAKVSGTYTKEL